MRLSLALAALLCFTTWMSVVRANNRPLSVCCPGISTTTVPLKQIVNYTNQTEGICPLAAVAFLTKSGKRICSDPNNNWTKRAMLKVDEEKKKKRALHEKRQNEEASTSGTTPFVSTTSGNTLQTKRRNGRRHRA